MSAGRSGDGIFISLEGPDGAGKSTQVAMLVDALASQRPLLVREPGGTPVGEAVRRVVLHTRVEMSREAEMYLYMAARAELVETVIKPALEEGRLVIADRYHDSTRAYQGGGRGAAVAWPAQFPVPDLTLLIDLPVGEALGRVRSGVARYDRLEAEPEDFHRRVADAYAEMAAAEPARWRVVDASGSPEAVHQGVLAAVQPLLQSILAH